MHNRDKHFIYRICKRKEKYSMKVVGDDQWEKKVGWYKRGNQESVYLIMTDNTKAKRKKDKQRSTKHSTENKRSTNTNSTKTRGWSHLTYHTGNTRYNTIAALYTILSLSRYDADLLYTFCAIARYLQYVSKHWT